MLQTIIKEVMRKGNIRNIDSLERDINIVLTYFGFGKEPNPTYQSIAEEYGVRRQRVGQIISTRFIDKVASGNLEILQDIENIIKQEEAILIKELLQTLINKNFLDNQVNPKGLLSLLHKFNLCNEYSLFNLNIERASESDFVSKQELLLVKKGHETELTTKIGSIKTFPGLHGLVRYSEVVARNEWLQGEKAEFYKKVITSSKNVCTINDSEGDMWYLFEDRANVLINTLGKIRNITNQVKIDILAQTIHSEINKRTLQKAIPSVEMIKSYLIQSKFVTSDGEYALLNVDKRELRDIEKEILNYFSEEKKISATFSEINAYLTKKGFSDASITQKVYHCSFLYVDKSGGRRNYKFILILRFTPEYDNTQEEVRYKKYRDRLSQLIGSTDTSREVKLRNEQAILRDWLFKGKDATCCAICGRLFTTGSLVAAHKKKRSHCTDEERKDPNIVMPVCLFGCDTLYERGIISVESGSIVVCWQTGLQRAEIEYVEGLEHRKVDEQWLVGKSTQYFDKAIT
ncbi:hypothetical protein [Rossellomorea sp. FM04394]|uniref:hypothetical protein n=1 Tax=Rossellomorea sp. FM04394 TaxID=3243076 RepID=UPI0035A727B5